MHTIRNIGTAAVLAGLFAVPLTVRAQDEQVGEAAGAVVGGVTSGGGVLLGVDERPRFREYVIREHRSAYRLSEPVEVGTVLPETGIVLYTIPPEFGVPASYRYAVVNDGVVFVDPRTRTIVEVVE